MNLRNNKGYVITDVSIAVIILLILVPVIMGMVYGIGASKLATEVKSEAINIAINTIEESKLLPFDENALDNKSPEVYILNNVQSKIYHVEHMSVDENEKNAVINTDKASYKLEIQVTDYNTINTEADENIVKMVKATVEYKIRGETKKVELSTVIK